ncbi:MAG: hypothetical protein DWQ05_01505 [Calditrichaeota bacterium]|nr:MAG: hypothetical protein DWQ05_01505 [Calditrichota bacterium]
MEERKNILLQLLQYPMLILSIILGMALISFLFQIDFSRLSKVGPEGIEFYEDREREISGVFSDLETRMNELASKVEFLESRLAEPEQEKLLQRAIEQFEETQITSTKTAQLARSSSQAKESLLAGRSGYIWIGDWGEKNKAWQRLTIVQVEGEEIRLEPEAILPGMKFRVSGNMVLRDGKPDDSPSYYRSKESIGTIPKGSKILTLESPVRYDRRFTIQCWMKVEVLE